MTAMTESLSLEGLEFAVARSARRRTIGITIERDGDLVVTAPEGVGLDRVESVVRGKLFWVFGKLAERALLFQPPPEKEYVSGEGFHYLGRSYRLLLTDQAPRDAESRLRLTGGRFVLSRRDQPRAAELFTKWYTAHGLVWLRRRAGELADRVGKEPEDVRVRDLGNRWGSCTGAGVLNFHWRVIRLPATLVEYVVAHELVHLLEPRHDAAFWNRLERVMPDYRRRKRLLAEHGGSY